MSAVPDGAEFQVNTFTTNDQSNAEAAMDADGDFVVVWDGPGQGDLRGVFAQLYNAAGVAQGAEFQVNTYTTDTQDSPDVAMDADGNFVVVWFSNGQDGSDFGIFAQRYAAGGAPLGSEFQVNTFTTGFQSAPSVAMDADGDFVVAWESGNQDGHGSGIYAQRYDAAGTPQGTEFQVNTHTTDRQRVPSIGMDADGDFVVAWQSRLQDGDGYGIYAQRYNAAGAGQGAEFQVNTHTTDNQQRPAVALDADGDFVVAWHSTGQDGNLDGIFAQRYNAAGVAQGSEFNVNSHTTGNQRFVSVALNNDGDFVVAWTGYAQDGSGANIVARRYDAAGVAQGPDLQVNSFTTASQRVPSVAMDADGDFVVAWTSHDGQDGNDTGIFAQRFVDTTEGLEFQVNTFTTNFQGAPSVAMDADGDFVVSWSGSGLGDSNQGIVAQRFDSAGAAQGPEFQVNTYTTGNQAISTVAMDANGNFVVTWGSSGQDGSGAGAYAQRYDAAGLAQGSEFRVNTYTTGSQQFPAVAMDSDGDFVVAWQSYGQDGGGGVSDYGIYAQRYDALGVAQGTEFQVNTYTTDGQREPAVAMDADGNFVVAWQSRGQDGQATGIFAQRYDASGAAQGGEFQVNSYTTDQQQNPSIAMDANGNFVVAWHSAGQDGSGYGVYAQRYDAAGVAQGNEFRVATFTSGSQRYSTVAMDADGDFVVAWQGDFQDGLFDYGIFAQRYNAAGIPQGGEFRVHTYTTDQQRLPAAAMDADGDFVVAWASEGQDGSSYGVYAQRYNAFPPNPSSVVGRHLFYNESSYDNDTPGIDAADGAAIATDKIAYLPGGGLIRSANMTSYSRGINGIMVDLAGPHATLSLADFDFAVSNQGAGGAGANNTPSTWVAAPAPTAFTVLSDTPAAGTDRVEFIWADGAIENRYLEVAVKGNDAAGGHNTNTNLAATDIFYFGNIIGDTFNDAVNTVFLTTAADETAIQGSPIISAASITSPHDIDRNGVHLASDRILARGNTIFALARISIGNPPAAPASNPNDERDAGLAVASALTIPSPPQTPRSVSSNRAASIKLDASRAFIAAGLPLLEEAHDSRARALSEAADDAAIDFDLDQALLELLAGKLD